MKFPPLLLGCAVLFWGWQTGLLILSAPIALILEAPRFSRWRWDLHKSDFHRFGDLAMVILLAVIVLHFLGERRASVVYVTLRWLPVVLLPVVLGQVYSTAGRIPLTALFITLRRMDKSEGDEGRWKADIRYAFFGTCLLSAGVGNHRNGYYFIPLVVILGWALLPRRARRFSPALWVLTLGIAAVAGFHFSARIHRLQLTVEERVVDLLSRLPGDARREKTAIGDVRSLKESSGILFRVKTPAPLSGPLLLRETAYNLFEGALWRAVRPGLADVPSEDGGRSWRLEEGFQGGETLRIIRPFRDRQALLALPYGSLRIEGLPAASLRSGRLGSVEVEGPPGFRAFRVRYAAGVVGSGEPDSLDLFVPDEEFPALAELSGSFGQPESPPEALRAVREHFLSGYSYSLDPGGDGSRPTALAAFLLDRKAGHCEYFATAATLLLRHLGVPARYAVGYSVQEYSHGEQGYVVRRRHAHAWTEAYLDGRWEIVDTTPPGWLSHEERKASALQPVRDLFSRAKFFFLAWKEQAPNRRKLILVLALLFLVLIYRLARKQASARREDVSRRPVEETVWSGADSEWYFIERHLQESGRPRAPSEPVSHWLERTGHRSLRPILLLHYRYRFDPEGLTSEERLKLKKEALAWLADPSIPHPGLQGPPGPSFGPSPSCSGQTGADR